MPARPTHRSAYGVKILNSQHKAVRHLKRQGYVAEIHGNKFWHSSFLVMEYLKQHPLPNHLNHSSQTQPLKSSPKEPFALQMRVLEIGCGWGLLGIYCAKKFRAKVTGIDADKNVLPYLKLHAEINKVEIVACKISLQQLNLAKLSQYNIILGADICFWDDMTRQLYNLISQSMQAGVKAVMIADPGRPPFADLIELCRKKYDDMVVIEKTLQKPVRTSGKILIVRG